MPVVMATLLVLTLLAAAMHSMAVQSTSNAGGDSRAKRALGAAEAGLQTAAYRLNKVDPAGTMCFTTIAVAPNGSGECPATTPEAVGTGGTFRYTVTPTGAACSSLPGVPTSTYDRCITSIGVVSGVQRRIQARVIKTPPTPFANGGVIGSESVQLTDEVTVETDVGSNGPITLTGTPGKVEVKAFAKLYPPATVTRTGTTTLNGIANSDLPFGVGAINFAATLPPTGTNSNALLSPTYYNSTTRALNIPAGANYVMPAGSRTYNLCSWTMGKGAELKMASSADMGRFYIDSPRRPGSGCPAGSGKVVFDGLGDEIKINTGRFDANVSVYLYGTTSNGSAEDILIQNKAHIDAVWFAPNSIFHATNDITIHGGMSARKVILNHKVSAKLDAALQSWVSESGLVLRRAWTECKPNPTVASDPESGC